LVKCLQSRLSSGDAGHPSRKAFEGRAAEVANTRLAEVVVEAKAAGVTCQTDDLDAIPGDHRCGDQAWM
jgi:hypothetical protein